MLRVFRSLKELHFGKLMDLYRESNEENAKILFPNMDRNAALITAEQEFYAYLRDCFFVAEAAVYYVWEENGGYISGLRLEGYRDGFLLEALETCCAFRGKGYGRRLMQASLSDITVPVYSHVGKDNTASLAVHIQCGFECISDDAVYIDGTVNPDAYTLRRISEKVVDKR